MKESRQKSRTKISLDEEITLQHDVKITEIHKTENLPFKNWRVGSFAAIKQLVCS